MIDLEFIKESLPLLLAGLNYTLQIAFFSSALGITLGSFAGIALTSKAKLLRFFISIYVTIIRGTPMLIQIAALYYSLNFAGIAISAFWSAILSIGLNSGAYVSQIIVSGINSVGKGQIEAAQTLGFSNKQITQLIVLPQAVRTVLPALGNEFVTLVKDSSLASVIGVHELTKSGAIIISRTFDAPSVYLIVGLLYLILTSIVSLIISHFERKLKIPC